MWKFRLPLRVLSAQGKCSFINQLYIKLGQFPLFWPDSSIQRKSRVSLSNYLQKSFHSLLVPIVLRFQNDNLLWEHLLIYHSFWYAAVAALKSHKYCRYKKFLFALTRKKIQILKQCPYLSLSKANSNFIQPDEFWMNFPFKIIRTFGSFGEIQNFLKFSFSEKATKMCAIVLMVLKFT